MDSPSRSSCRVATRLEGELFVARGAGGRVRVLQPGLLLNAWRAAYHFDAHTVVRGHLAARSGDARSRLVAEAPILPPPTPPWHTARGPEERRWCDGRPACEAAQNAPPDKAPSPRPTPAAPCPGAHLAAQNTQKEHHEATEPSRPP